MKNRKRMICLLLSVVMVLGMLSGCGNSQAEGADSAQNTPPGQTQELTTEGKIKELDIPGSWKRELSLAAYIGIPLDNLEKNPITGAEMAELTDSLVAYEAPDKLAQWQTMYPAFRAYEEPLLRVDVQSMLFLAAQFIGGPYTDCTFTLRSCPNRGKAV